MGNGGNALRAATCLALITTMAALLPQSSTAAPPPGPSYECTTAAGPTGSSPTKIMIAGDSVTSGSTGDYTWRYWLWRDLVDRGANVDFVGSFDDLIDPNTQVRGNKKYLDCNFDQDTEARTSARLYNPAGTNASYNRQAASTDPTKPNYPGYSSWIRGAVAKYDPQVLVAFVGNLDIGYPAAGATDQEAADEVIKQMTTFINQARLGNSGVDIILTTAPTPPTSSSTRFAKYNQGLANLVATKSTAASRLVLAQMPSWANHSWDGYHADANGEVAIAATINGALHQLFGSLPPKPTTLQKPRLGPRRPAVLNAALGGDGKADLSWTFPPGGDRTFIYARNVTGNGPWVLQADLVKTSLRSAYKGIGTAACDMPCTSYTVTGLSGGTTYAFEVRVAKGKAVATDIVSNVRTLKATGPLGKVVTAKPVRGIRKVTVKWYNLGGTTGYQVRWRKASATRWAGTTGASGSPRVISGLTGGTKYAFQVRARNASGYGAWSTVVLATPKRG